MSYSERMTDLGYTPVSSNDIDARLRFVRKTYAHLGGAILAFIGLEALLLSLDITKQAIFSLFSMGAWAWIGVLVVFSLIGMVADWWASNMESKPMQYLGLGLYVVAEAVIFAPLLYIASAFSDPAVIPAAGILTLITFAGLTVSVFATRKDFSFLRSGIIAGSLLAFALIIFGAVFGFTLGLLFSGAMVALASACILYYTSNVLHHYHTDQHVAASLALFSAVALLFWYILRLVMAFAGE